MIHIFFEKLKSYFFDVSTVMTESRLQSLCTQLKGESVRESRIANERLFLDQAGRTILPENTPKPSAQSLECSSSITSWRERSNSKRKM